MRTPAGGSCRPLLAACVWACVIATQAHARPDPASACTPDACSAQDVEAVRDGTETLYGDVLLVLSAHERPALRSDQNAWRQRARQHCLQQAPQGSRHHACMVEQHLQRRQTLRHWLMNGYQVD